jgi:putative endonuclease
MDHRSARPVESKQPGLTAPAGPLGDLPRWELVVEINSSHRQMIEQSTLERRRRSGSGTMVSGLSVDQKTFGRRAEWAALVLLVFKGYRLRHRNWRGGGAELDLVVERGGEIVFVEVKARSSGLFGGAVGAVDATKRRHLTRGSSAYLSHHDLWERPCRFDIVALEKRDRFPYWSIRHLQNAFQTDFGRSM